MIISDLLQDCFISSRFEKLLKEDIVACCLIHSTAVGFPIKLLCHKIEIFFQATEIL
jgi:hypothetical protein